MMNNRILMIVQAPFPPDIRLEKEIKSLFEAGYETLVVCNQYDRTKNPEYQFCQIKRVKALFKSIKINRIINFPIFLNPRYFFIVFISTIKFKPDFIHGHDLPMVPIAILLGFLFRLPVIFDMHENYPEALKAFQKKGIINFLFKNYHLAKILERICLKFSNRIIVVVEENKYRLIQLGIDPEIIYIVSNTVDLDTFLLEPKVNKSDLLKDETRPIVLYTGTVSPDRGLLTAIQSAFHFKEQLINPLLVIVGEGSYKKELINFVEKNDLKQYVRFIDWPGHNYIPLHINSASICMIPQPFNDFINTTIPHKLFEYMLMAKPLLVSDALPLKRIVEETKSGLFFKSCDAKDFAVKLKLLLTLNDDWGINGRNAVQKKFNWNIEAKELLRVYDSFNFVKNKN